MSGLGMMLMGAAWMALSWIFVRYNGASFDRVTAFAIGCALFIFGMMRVMVELHPLAFGG